MNRDSAAQTRDNFSGRESWTWLIVLAPTVGLAALFTYGALGQRLVSRRVTSILDQMADSGLPTNNHQLVRWYEEHTSDTNSLRWRNAVRSIDGLNTRFIDLDDTSTKERERVPAPDSEWTVAPIMDQYVQEAQPILDVVSTLLDDESAVWEPLLFWGNATILYRQGPTRANDLIADEFRVAVHSGDRGRAIAALALMERLAASVDTESGAEWDALVFDVLNQRCQLIRQSLDFDFWSPEDLLTLDETLANDHNIDARYALSQSLFRSLSIESFDSDPFAYYSGVGYLSPSAELAALNSVPISTVLPSAGVARLVRDLERQEQQQLEGKLDATSALAAITAISSAFLRDDLKFNANGVMAYFDREMIRRWTRTAVAIKRYRVAEGRFPANLSDLGAVGLPSSEMLADGSARFGYEENGERAILWTRPRVYLAEHLTEGVDREIGRVPPSQSGQHLDELINVETVIR